MQLIYNKVFLEHDTGSHPENANRIKHFFNEKETEIINGEKYLGLAHSQDYINTVEEYCVKEILLTADTVVCKESYKTACYAAGAAIMAAEKQGFALVRPPGHHAGSSYGGGFCLFNNIAIATKSLINQGKKVFILDFDIHHGNGTEDILFGEENAIYFSTHQIGIYLGTGLESKENCINIALPFGTTDKEYIKVLHKNLIPALNKFKPDIIGVSAGFDSYYKDFCYMHPEVGFKLTRKSYEEIINIIGHYPNFYVLEGGYNPESIKEGVELFLQKRR